MLAGMASAQKTVNWGFEQRVRNENWNNSLDFSQTADDQRIQVRYRTRLWMDSSITKDIRIGLGLNSETKQITTPNVPFHVDEVIFETAYLDFQKLFVKGLSLRFGRQNLYRGEGFLFFDGGPLDGSRAFYQNAAVLGYEWKRSRLEAIGIFNPSSDRFLPRLNDRNRMLVEWDEQAIGAYYQDRNLAKTGIDGYYFFKKEFNDVRSPENPQYNPGRNFHTAGGRLVQLLSPKWTAGAEWAFQWGHEKTGADVRGWGGYGHLRRTFGSRDQHHVQTGYWAMSGDDPSTPGRNEGWDPMFSRWPTWSELYIYTMATEKGLSYWTNIGMWQAQAVLAPARWMRSRFTYYHLNSFHRFDGNPALYGNGTTRGDLYQIRTDVRYRQKWTGHVVYERLAPGSFYTNPDKAWFLRFEVVFHHDGHHEF